MALLNQEHVARNAPQGATVARLAVPKLVVMATAAASRPVAMRIRPRRG
jgi:hypothetical protein